MTQDALATTAPPTAPPTASPTAARRSKRGVWLLLLILIMAAALRWHALARESLGFDELFSIHFATARGPWETALPSGVWMEPAVDLLSVQGAPPWWHIWTGMGYDTHPPLHPIILRAWLFTFGPGDVAARLLSVACSLACILFVFDAARVAGGWRAGLWAAAVATVMASQIQYAQEVRSYIMLSMLTAALLAVAARLIVLGASWRRLAGFAGISLAMMLTHYFAIGAIVPVAIVTLIALERAWRWRLAACCAAAALVFAISWGPFMLEQRGNFIANMGWIADDDPGLPLRSLRRAALLPLRLLFEPGGRLIDAAATGRGILWMTPLLLLVVPAALAAKHRTTWLFVAGVVGPIVLVAVADISQHRQTLNLIRYTLPAGAGLCCLIATAGIGRSPLLSNLLPAAVVLGCLGALPRAWDGDKPLWREYVQAATRDLQRGDVIVLLREPGREWAGALVYMALSRYMPPINCSAIVLDGPASRETIDRLQRHRRIVVISEAANPPIDRYLPGLPAATATSWIPYAGSYAHIRMKDDPPATATATSPATDR